MNELDEASEIKETNEVSEFNEGSPNSTRLAERVGKVGEFKADLVVAEVKVIGEVGLCMTSRAMHGESS